MSQGLLIGQLVPVLFNNGTFPLQITTLENASGVTLTSATRFTISDLGPYFMWLTVRAAGNVGGMQWTVQVFNVTTGLVLDEEVVPSGSTILEDYAFYFTFVVTNPAHEYEIRLVLTQATAPRNNFMLQPPTFKAVISSTFGGGAGSPEYAGGQLDSGGGGVPIAPGSFVQFSVFNNYVIREGRLLATPPGGTIVVDVLISTFAAYPAFASITGGTPLTIVAGDKVSDTALVGWTTAIPGGSIVRMATIAPPPVITERCTCELLLQRA